MKRKLLVFEGSDGAGKTTQLELVAARLRKEGHDVLVTREPGGTRLGEQVRPLVKETGRKIALSARTQLFLFAASFAQNWHEVIRPALEEGKIVLVDRLYFSTLAYQSFAGGLPFDEVKSTCLLAFDNYEPDLALYFDVDEDTRARRLSGRGGTDAIEAMGSEFFVRVKDGFCQMVTKGELEAIDASGTPEEVFALTWAKVDKALTHKEAAL